MSIRGGRSPRDPGGANGATPPREPNPYRRSGRYGKGPGDQRRYGPYDRRGSSAWVL